MTGDTKAVAAKPTGTNEQVTRPKTASGAQAAATSKAPKKATTASRQARKTAAVAEPAAQVAATAKTAEKTAKNAAKNTVKNTGNEAAGKTIATAELKSSATKRSRPRRVITAQERWRMISENAYYRAESRGFAGGSPAEDWAAAAAEIDAELARTKTVVES